MARQEYISLRVRITKKMLKQFAELAKANKRSRNREIVARLEESLSEHIEKDRHSQLMSRLDAIEAIVKGDFYGF